VYHMLGTECVLKGAGAVLFRHVAQYVLGVLADYGVRNPTERFPVWKREQIFTAMSRRQQYVAVAFVADMMLNPRRSYRYTAWRDCVFYVLLLSLFNMIEDEVRWMKYPPPLSPPTVPLIRAYMVEVDSASVADFGEPLYGNLPDENSSWKDWECVLGVLEDAFVSDVDWQSFEIKLAGLVAPVAARDEDADYWEKPPDGDAEELRIAKELHQSMKEPRRSYSHAELETLIDGLIAEGFSTAKGRMPKDAKGSLLSELVYRYGVGRRTAQTVLGRLRKERPR